MVPQQAAINLKESIKLGVLGIHAIIYFVADAFLKNLLLMVMSFGAIAFASVPAHSQQIISDEKIGKTMAEVKCGERDVNAAVRYLNNMGVPVSKISNMGSYPDVMRGFNRHLRWKNC